MPAAILTQARLKELLLYDPDTGTFKWKVDHKHKNAKKGMVAGTRHPSGYRFIIINGKRYPAHRLAFLYMTGKLPADQVDHLNHVRSDNRWKNLRPATRALNHKNQKLNSNNTSGRVGVHWHKPSNKWRAQITVNKKKVNLGYYTNFKKACYVRQEAERKYGFHENHGKEL